jgi:Ni,Fe-hydrogenase maturation factor
VDDPSRLALVDAADGVPAGDVAMRKVEGPPDADPSMTHHLEPESLLGLARALFGAAPSTVLVSIGVRSLDVGERLTPEVADAALRAAGMVLDIVEEHRRA